MPLGRRVFPVKQRRSTVYNSKARAGETGRDERDEEVAYMKKHN
jgi:hypothetical protein